MTVDGSVKAVMTEKDKKHEELKNQLIKDVFGNESSRDGVPIEKVTMLIWHCRNEPRVVKFMARFLTKYAGNRDVFDGIEFYLPQLAHMIIHLEANWDDAVLEQFALIISQHSLHFALQLNWILQGAIEDYQPETREGEPNPSFNALYYTRCVKLLSKLERCVVYGRPLAHELHRLYEKGKITRKEYEQMELADRRFNAAQIMEQKNTTVANSTDVGGPGTVQEGGVGAGGAGGAGGGLDANPYGGWLLYKRRSRKSWHKRKQWKRRYFTVSDQMLYCHVSPPNDLCGDSVAGSSVTSSSVGEDWSTLRRTMPLEGATVKITLNGNHPHMFEVHNQYYLFKLRADSKEELDHWMTLLRDEAEHPALFSHELIGFQRDSTYSNGNGDEGTAPAACDVASVGSGTGGGTGVLSESERENKKKLVMDLNPAEHARYTFFKEERAFVRDMCDVAEKLRFEEREDRKKLAPGFMEKLAVPSCCYIPMCNNSDPWRRVMRFLPKDTKVFNTKERCPTIMFYVNEKGKPGDANIDVADFLHREYDVKEEFDHGSIAVVDGDVYKEPRESATTSTVWAAASYDEDDVGGSGGGGGTSGDAGDNENEQQGEEKEAEGEAIKNPLAPRTRKVGRFQSMFIKEKDWLQIPQTYLDKIPHLDKSPTRRSVFNTKKDTTVDHEAFPVRSVRILESQNPLSGGNEVETVDKQADAIDQESLERAKQIVCGGETWSEKSMRLLHQESKTDSDLVNTVIGVVMAKSNDDVRQEVFVMQMIHYYHSIFVNEGLPIWLKTYRILSTSKDTGLIEFLKDATSIDGLKKSDGFPERGGLRAYFHQVYGSEESPSFQAAQYNFMVSLVGYSLVSYLLGLKDRHNGNIMLDTRGRIIHIDFGFAMGMAPGHEFSFERAPFKLTSDYMEVMGGVDSSCFAEFKRLFVAGFEVARANSQVALGLVEIMMYQSNYPCFSGSRYGGGVALMAFKERLMLHLPDSKIKKKALQLIDTSIEHTGVYLYDKFQLQSNGIMP